MKHKIQYFRRMISKIFQKHLKSEKNIENYTHICDRLFIRLIETYKEEWVNSQN